MGISRIRYTEKYTYLGMASNTAVDPPRINDVICGRGELHSQKCV